MVSSQSAATGAGSGRSTDPDTTQQVAVSCSTPTDGAGRETTAGTPTNNVEPPAQPLNLSGTSGYL